MNITEIRIMHTLMREPLTVTEIARQLGKSKQHTYHELKKLETHQFVYIRRGKVFPEKYPHVQAFLSIAPTQIEILADLMIPLLAALDTPKTVADIQKLLGVRKSSIYATIRKARLRGLIFKRGASYVLNTSLWPECAAFINAYRAYLLSVDPRIPPGTRPYAAFPTHVLFSSKTPCAATETAFSAFKNHGVPLLMSVAYYTLPERNLSLQEIFRHALIVADRPNQFREKLYCCLFMLKHPSVARANFHPITLALKEVLAGTHIPGYPPLNEIKEKAEMYGIEVP